MNDGRHHHNEAAGGKADRRPRRYVVPVDRRRARFGRFGTPGPGRGSPVVAGGDRGLRSRSAGGSATRPATRTSAPRPCQRRPRRASVGGRAGEVLAGRRGREGVERRRDRRSVEAVVRPRLRCRRHLGCVQARRRAGGVQRPTCGDARSVDGDRGSRPLRFHPAGEEDGQAEAATQDEGQGKDAGDAAEESKEGEDERTTTQKAARATLREIAIMVLALFVPPAKREREAKR